MASNAVNLHLPQVYIYTTGSYVQGEVVLDYLAAQRDEIEEIHVKLRGYSRTQIKVRDDTHREVHPIIYANLSLWNRGSAYPPPDSHQLRLPFQFLLPVNIPPSFEYVYSRTASVQYSVTAVGVRPGTFQFNRRIPAPLVILPADPAGALLSAQLSSANAHQTHEWRRFFRTDKIRRGLWGEYSTVFVELLLPDAPDIPLFADIPFDIKIVTTTAPMSRSKADSHPLGKPVFPAPPVSYDELTFKVSPRLSIQARGYTRHMSMGSIHIAGPATHTETPEKEWVIVPGDGRSGGNEMGTWVQRTRFQSTFRINTTPTFSTSNIQLNYDLVLKIDFPGIGNSFEMTVPIVLGSGLVASVFPAPVQAQESGEIAPQYPRLDLPPSYYSHIDLDEKD